MSYILTETLCQALEMIVLSRERANFKKSYTPFSFPVFIPKKNQNSGALATGLPKTVTNRPKRNALVSTLRDRDAQAWVISRQMIEGRTFLFSHFILLATEP